MRRLSLILVVLLAAALVCTGLGYRAARADPVERRARVALADWPAGARPVRIALLSDIHIGNAATDAARLVRVADQVSAARPDLVVLAGDFIAGNRPVDAAAAPALLPGLRRLRAPMGVIAVLGNHDHWTAPAEVRATLAAAGITVLANQAIRRGPMAIGGVDDLVTHHADLAATRAAMAAVGGARVMISHSPDVAPRSKSALVLAGHTHCGQVVLPLIGPLVHVSRYGERYRCGLVREGARMVIVTGGIGTSVLPLRWGAPPDWWLVEVGGSSS